MKKHTIDSISRRMILKYGLGAAAASAGLSIVPAWAEPSFTIGQAGGSWGNGIKKTFVEASGFATKHNVRPSYLDSPSSVLASRLVAQPDNPPYSVGQLLDLEHYLAADAGALQSYDLDIVTNYGDIYPTTTFAPRAGLENWAASVTIAAIAVTRNTKLASEPQSWADLWRDEYKGRVGIPDFGWFGLVWLHAINKHLGGSEDNVDRAIQAVADLKKKNGAIVIKNQDHAVQAFTSEEIVIMPYWNGRTFALQESGVPVDITYVPGTIQSRNGFVIAKNTQFRELANHFINTTLDGELQLQFARAFYYPPANRTVTLPSEIAHYAIPESALEQSVSLDFRQVNESRAALLDRWNREVLG